MLCLLRGANKKIHSIHCMPSIIYFSILISCSTASTLRSSATYCSMVTNFWRGHWNSGWTCGLKSGHYG